MHSTQNKNRGEGTDLCSAPAEGEPQSPISRCIPVGGSRGAGGVPLALYAEPSRSDPDGRSRAKRAGAPGAHKGQGAATNRERAPCTPQVGEGKQHTKQPTQTRGCPTLD